MRTDITTAHQTRTSRSSSRLCLAVVLLVMASCVASAQADSVSLDQYKLLQKKRNERAMLSRILAAMNVVDSAYVVHYPTWIIRDEDIRQRVFKTFRNRLKFPSRDSSLIVITSPEHDEIVRLSMGDVALGREETRLYLGDNIRRAILAPDYPRTELEPSVESKRHPIFDPPIHSVMFEGSAFGGKVSFANGWGLQARVGNDAMGFPFWSSGSVEMLRSEERRV